MTEQTDEQINEAVHETLGNCVHEWKPTYPKPMAILSLTCTKCQEDIIPNKIVMPGDEVSTTPDYVNDPRLWWPLAEEMIKDGHCISWCKQEAQYIIGCPGYTCISNEIGWDKNAGRAFCQAYLILHKRMVGCIG